MLFIATDGACRYLHPSDPDNKVSCGAYFVQVFSEGSDVASSCSVASVLEHGSTNQRAEILAITAALEYFLTCEDEPDALITTDSEYVFNCLTKRWYDKWVLTGWKTSAGEDVKNQDLWKRLITVVTDLETCGATFTMYHIKGHVITMGAKAAAEAFAADETCETLFKALSDKYDQEYATKRREHISHAKEVFLKNNLFEPDDAQLKRFITANLVADLVASTTIVKEQMRCIREGT